MIGMERRPLPVVFYLKKLAINCHNDFHTQLDILSLMVCSLVLLYIGLLSSSGTNFPSNFVPEIKSVWCHNTAPHSLMLCCSHVVICWPGPGQEADPGEVLFWGFNQDTYHQVNNFPSSSYFFFWQFCYLPKKCWYKQ